MIQLKTKNSKQIKIPTFENKNQRPPNKKYSFFLGSNLRMQRLHLRQWAERGGTHE
jgi:hypothetical protein